jgi:hypothetical protein
LHCLCGAGRCRLRQDGSWFVIAATLPLAFGIAFDAYMAAFGALDSAMVAMILAAAAIVALVGFWYAYPLAQRLASP